MAATMASDKEAKGPSMAVQFAVLAALTLLAASAGWLSGSMLGGRMPPIELRAASDRAHEITTAEVAESLNIVHLDPITTNLGSPADMWVRAELSLVFSGDADILVAERVHQDLLAYLRTVKFHQIEGASGFLHLKADLTERASIRSDGTVNELLIRTLLFE